MRGLYSHSREYRKIFWRHHFPHISEILEGLNVGANTCRACIRTRANTGKKSWRIIYVLVSCQGVLRGNLLPRIIVLELMMRGNFAAWYVEKARLEASGVNNDAKISSKSIFSGVIGAIWLRLRFVIRIANRKSLAIWNTVNLLRKAHCSDYLYRKTALRF